MSRNNETVIQSLARACAVQVSSFRGKKRDELTVAFWLGAWSLAVIQESEDASWIGRVTQLLIATRGFAEVERIVKEADAAEDARVAAIEFGTETKAEPQK